MVAASVDMVDNWRRVGLWFGARKMRNEQNKARKQAGESKAKTRGKDCARSDYAAASRDLVRVFSTANERLLDLAPFDLGRSRKVNSSRQEHPGTTKSQREP